tara:strand:- start:301 stop:897 length:597 start_codon:yes stop_codon:yes gene_type:complete
MFSGIIYNQGIVKDIKKSKRYSKGSLVLEISSNIKFNKKDIGESVCCDGVCLTLIRIQKKSFLFYLSKETIDRSIFKKVKIGNRINIEKSIFYGQKISGHYVQGHVDTTAKVKFVKIIGKFWIVEFKIPNNFMKYIVEKASISINGVSLTISKITKSGFQVTVIPHTLKLTNLINLKKGRFVNIEFDIFSKYLLKLGN